MEWGYQVKVLAQQDFMTLIQLPDPITEAEPNHKKLSSDLHIHTMTYRCLNTHMYTNAQTHAQIWPFYWKDVFLVIHSDHNFPSPTSFQIFPISLATQLQAPFLSLKTQIKIARGREGQAYIPPPKKKLKPKYTSKRPKTKICPNKAFWDNK